MANVHERALVSLASASDGYYDLDRKGPMDEARHRRRVDEAVRNNLGDLISRESIITSDGKNIVRVPLDNLELPRFLYDPLGNPRTGQGNGDSKTGDTVIAGQGQGQGPGKGKRAGQIPGIDYMEAEVYIDRLAEILFAQLGLPNLKPKKMQETETETIVFNDVRKKGVMSNLDKRRTIMENLRRNAIAGKPGFHGITDEDLRFKTWRPTVKKDSNAVVIAMRDVSGSMGEFEKFITRASYFWMVRFLRSCYNNVEIVFITHHTEAKVVDEQTFFGLGESGGTKVSPAYKLANDLIDEKFNPESWNVYPFHYTDGDNLGDADNRACLEEVQKMLAKGINMFGYAEIHEHEYGLGATLMSAFNALKDDARFRKAIIKSKDDIAPSLQKFFSESYSEGAVSRI